MDLLGGRWDTTCGCCGTPPVNVTIYIWRAELKKMRHALQNIFLDKDEKKRSPMFRQAGGFVKNKLACSQSKSCWQISPHSRLIRETFSKSKAAIWSPKGGKSERFGLDLSLIGPQSAQLWPCKLSI